MVGAQRVEHDQHDVPRRPGARRAGATQGDGERAPEREGAERPANDARSPPAAHSQPLRLNRAKSVMQAPAMTPSAAG